MLLGEMAPVKGHRLRVVNVHEVEGHIFCRGDKVRDKETRSYMKMRRESWVCKIKSKGMMKQNDMPTRHLASKSLDDWNLTKWRKRQT
jgi:hypothetical protein